MASPPPSTPLLASTNGSHKESTSSDASTLEASETTASIAPTAKPFLITRLLRTILPRSATIWRGGRLDAQSSLDPFHILDFLFYSSSWRLIWASALGHPFEASNFPALSNKRHVGGRIEAFDVAFARYRGQHGPSKAGSSRFPLLFALFAIFKEDIIEGTTCSLLAVIVIVSQVLIYKVIIGYMIHFYHAAGPTHHSYGEGVAYMFASAASIFTYSLLDNRGSYTMSVVGGEMRTLVAASVARKSLVISPLARRQSPLSLNHADTLKKQTDEDLLDQDESAEEKLAESEWSAGTVLNLVNTDAERIEMGMRRLNKAWPALVGIPLIMMYSYFLIGGPGPLSTAVVICLLFIIIPLVRALSRLRVRLNLATDVRVDKVNDLITGIRLLKAFAWEDVYADLVKRVRHRESKMNMRRIQLNGVVTTISEYCGRAPPILGVGLYSIYNNVDLPSSPNVLVYCELFYMISMFAHEAPQAIVLVVDAWRSLLRIEEYLLAEEFTVSKDLQIKNGIAKKNTLQMEMKANTMELNAAAFSWVPKEMMAEKQSEPNSHVDERTSLLNIPKDEELAYNTDELKSEMDFILHPITLSIRRNELVAITGPISAGKSSLAAGLAGCMPLLSGKVARQSLPVYAQATPWIRSASVRENIVFGLPYDERVYWHAVIACGLKQDLDRLESSDMTLLGERGITLSGGQKARLGLARAVYAATLSASTLLPASMLPPASDTIILDDPLSALDATTSAYVFDHAIQGSLKGMSRILVTHQTQVLSRCDRIIWMEHGHIKRIGTFEEVLEKEAAFRRFVGDKSQNSAGSEGATESISDVKIFSPEQEGSQIMVQEETQKDGIPWSVIAHYTYLPWSSWYFVIMFLVYAVSQYANVIWGVLFAWWSSNTFGLGNTTWVLILTANSIWHITLWLGTFIGAQQALTYCSEHAGNRALEGLLRSPISFLDTTPIGRILNRFTQDVNTLDLVLPAMLWSTVMGSFTTITVLLFTIHYVPFTAVLVIPWIGVAVLMALYYQPAPLAIKRIEAPLASQVISHISELVNGASVLRTSPYAEAYLRNELYNRIDLHNRVHLTAFGCHGWMNIRSRAFSCLVYFAIGLLGLSLRHKVVPGILIVVLMCCYDLVKCITVVLENSTEVLRGLNCVERLTHYEEGIGAERPKRVASFNTNQTWPSRGSIQLREVSMRYRPGLPLSLQGLNLSVQGGEKVGIVGRTGAGKSTIFSVLLGLTDPCQGQTLVDDIDITTIGVHDLREAVAVIPQDPTLFAGTVRSNLDPKRERTDDELSLALRRTGLLSDPHLSRAKEDDTDPTFKKQAPLTLTSRLSPGGSNLSSGQRQLLSLARAMVRDTRIILIDEATSGVDHESDMKIQSMLRDEFADRTVLAIAHRIVTVKDYDRVVVLDAGRCVEVGEPGALFDRRGKFWELCTRSGVVRGDLKKGESAGTERSSGT